MGWNQPLFVCLPFQILAEIGMGESKIALPHTLPFKLTMPNSVTTYITSERGVVTLFSAFSRCQRVVEDIGLACAAA
jgi:hypothetical protein